MIRAYLAKRYLDLKATDAQITVLFLYWLQVVGNSQTAKQMKELRLKYEITLERLEIFATKCYLQFCWVIHTSLHGSLHVLLADVFG